MMKILNNTVALLVAAILAAGMAGCVSVTDSAEVPATSAPVATSEVSNEEEAALAEKAEPSVSAVSAEENTETVSSGLYVVTTDSGTWYVSAAYAEKAAGTPVPTAGEASEYVSACETGEEAESSK